MSNYRPNIENPIPLVLLVPTYQTSYGVDKATYPTVEDALNEKDEKDNCINLFFGSFKSYGGTERDVNGKYLIEDTANIVTCFRPDIKSNCRVAVAQTNAIYEIINEPENVNMRNQFLKFKVRRYKGGS